MKEPNIRFKGFRGEWKTSIIGDIATFSKGRGYSKSDLRSEGNPIVLYGRLYTNYSSVIESVDTFASLQNGSVLTKGNEVIIPGSGETPEDIAVASAVEQKGVILGGDLNVLTFDQEKISPAFAAMSITYSNTHNELSGYAQGKTVVHLHNSSISKGHISYPYIDEQQSISTYFQHLDSLIQSTTKKIESLKQVKAASLQSMFPQEGETTPRVRFKGFEGEWEKVTIKDVATFLKGRGYSKSDLRVKGTPIILYGRIYTKYEACITNVDTYVNPLPNSIYTLGNEVVIPASGETPEDISCASAIKVRGIILGGDLNILRFDTDYYDTTFVAFSLSNGKAKKDLSNMAQGKSVVHLHNSDIEKVDMFIPSFVEQQQIASYFTNLDRQITLQTQRLEKLKQIKSACLDNMFV